MKKRKVPLNAKEQLLTVALFLAERKGFEPSIQSPVYYLSRVAPSTTRTPLCVYVGKNKENLHISKR